MQEECMFLHFLKKNKERKKKKNEIRPQQVRLVFPRYPDILFYLLYEITK